MFIYCIQKIYPVFSFSTYFLIKYLAFFWGGGGEIEVEGEIDLAVAILLIVKALVGLY